MKITQNLFFITILTAFLIWAINIKFLIVIGPFFAASVVTYIKKIKTGSLKTGLFVGFIYALTQIVIVLIQGIISPDIFGLNNPEGRDTATGMIAVLFIFGPIEGLIGSWLTKTIALK